MKKLTTCLFGLTVALSSQAEEPSLYQGKIHRLINARSQDFIGFSAYDPSYIMQSITNKNFNDTRNMRSDEIKFQISLGLPFWHGIVGKNSVLGASYTSQSLFQFSNFNHSSPFRDTKHEPQLFVGWTTERALPWGWRLNEIEAGINHQSNGRSNDELKSRSWNRIYSRFSAVKDNWIVEFKPWWRIPESRAQDDNPDITKYRSYGDLTVGYIKDKHQIKLTGHYHPKHNKGGLEVSYNYTLTKRIALYMQYYTGYGESLLDYNRNTKRIGIGIALNNVF